MAIVNTFVSDEKTVRVWEESRGNMILTRKFYVLFRLTMISGGHLNEKVFDTFSQAEKASYQWMTSLGDNWKRYNEFCTHIEGSNWSCYNKGVNAKCYISEEGGKLISEVVE